MNKNNSQRLISVCIPTSDMGGLGTSFLQHNFEILLTQTFKDFEVIVSDNSTTDAIEKKCKEYKGRLEIHYYKNGDPARAMSSNVNNVMRKATGKLIKMLFLDDYLNGPEALAEIAANFDLKKDHWLITGCEHTQDGVQLIRPFHPHYDNKIHFGRNTLGSPTVMTIKNENLLFFDENLSWLMDCDYYKRLYEKWGKPRILDTMNVVIRTGAHQASNTTATTALRTREYNYVMRKYNERKPSRLQLKNVTVVAVTGLNPAGAIQALEYCMMGTDFYDVVLIAHSAPADLDKRITFKKCKDTELASQDRTNTKDYSKFLAYDLCNYIESDYVLIVHNDAYILRPYEWRDEFYEYDYLGAPWRKDEHFTSEGVNVRVGNGGFSLRSKKMLTILNDLKLPFTDNGTGFYNEDGILCVYYRKILEDNGIKFAPVDLCAEFSLEKVVAETVWNPFGFHNNMGAIPRFFFLKFKLWKFYDRYFRNYFSKFTTALRLIVTRPKSFIRLSKRSLKKLLPTKTVVQKALPYADFPLLEGVALQNLCDYSFGDHSGVYGKIPGAYMKKANVGNVEFAEAVKNHTGKIMTLCIDNIRLYRRPLEYSDAHGLKKILPQDREWLQTMADEDLLELCSKFPQMKFIIFTALEDTPLDEHIKDRIPENVLAIHASDGAYFGGKVHPFPYGLQRKMYVGYERHGLLKKYMADDCAATKLLYINCNTRNGNRGNLNSLFVDKKWATVSPRRAYDEYLRDLKEHKFILCPSGNGIESTRNWEVLYMRRVPVLMRHPYLEAQFEGFPALFVDDFAEITEELLVKSEHLYQAALKINFEKLNLVKLFIERLEQL